MNYENLLIYSHYRNLDYAQTQKTYPFIGNY